MEISVYSDSFLYQIYEIVNPALGDDLNYERYNILKFMANILLPDFSNYF